MFPVLVSNPLPKEESSNSCSEGDNHKKYLNAVSHNKLHPLHRSCDKQRIYNYVENESVGTIMQTKPVFDRVTKLGKWFLVSKQVFFIVPYTVQYVLDMSCCCYCVSCLQSTSHVNEAHMRIGLLDIYFKDKCLCVTVLQ